MTRNQIEFQKLRETQRSNLANEAISSERNQATFRELDETHRHNTIVEDQATQNLGIESFKAASNRMSAEANVQSAQANLQNAETNRINAATRQYEAESGRMQAVAASTSAGAAVQQATAALRNAESNAYNAETSRLNWTVNLGGLGETKQHNDAVESLEDRKVRISESQSPSIIDLNTARASTEKSTAELNREKSKTEGFTRFEKATNSAKNISQAISELRKPKNKKGR